MVDADQLREKTIATLHGHFGRLCQILDHEQTQDTTFLRGMEMLVTLLGELPAPKAAKVKP